MTSFLYPSQRHHLREYMEANKGKKLVVTVEEAGRKRSLDQNARMWVVLTYISEQLADENGRKYSPEVWHEFMKAKLLGKHTVLIDGEPILVPKSTTKLKVMEFADYLTQIEAFAVDHGVHFYESLQEAS